MSDSLSFHNQTALSSPPAADGWILKAAVKPDFLNEVIEKQKHQRGQLLLTFATHLLFKTIFNSFFWMNTQYGSPRSQF